jgi:hypothetical protein
LINGSLIVVLFSDRIARPLLAGWWLLLIIMVAVRLGAWFWYRSLSATEQMHRRWGTFAILGSGASGLLWGTAGVLFYVPGDFHVIVLGLVLGGMGAGALVSLTPYIWATGYSSLGRLQGLPVDKLKIDKCFIKGLGCSRDAELIVRAIIALGRSLGLRVVAEGVQNQDQIGFLKAEGCHGVQGFYLAPPLPSTDVTRMLTSGFVRWSGGDGGPKTEAMTGSPSPSLVAATCGIDGAAHRLRALAGP